MQRVVLLVRHLTKRYGSVVAVDDLNLEIYEKEVFGFLGPNGAGKTTSINMMCGLLKPDEGSVLINGRAVDSGDDGGRVQIGICPQNIIIWSHLTCIEQLQFMGELYGMKGKDARARGDLLLEELGMTDRRAKQARTLSGGLQRRLNLAMALVHDPGIVVLDEPEVGLDPQSRVAVREYIKRLARQKTVILTTHNMDEVDRVADRVAVIDHGRLLVLDTPRALKSSVGRGDVLEIGLKKNGDCLDLARSALQELDERLRVRATEEVLFIRAVNVVALLPQILERLRLVGVPIGEVRVRENTLEDVFIQLTGRRLRE
jgi:ABC-2 type transport system ATP-binding protein